MIRWTGLLKGDDGYWIGVPWNRDMTVHVFGAFGAGESIVIEGSTETATSPIGAIIRHDLRDGAKTLVFTAAGMPLCLEAPVGMRPRVTAGTGRRR